MVRFALATLLSALLFVRADYPAVAQPHVLRYSAGIELADLQWLTPGSAAKDYLLQLTGAFFTRYGTGRAAPELVSLVPSQRNGGISADGKTITWHLRKGLKWADGEPLTSADVAFTVAMLKDAATNVGDPHDFRLIERVDTPDPQTAVFHLSRAYAPAIHRYFASDTYPILPRHLLSGGSFNSAAFWSLPVGAGPFKITKFARADRVELERNAMYFRGSPKLERILFKIIPSDVTTLNALRAGELDYVPSTTLREYAKLGIPPSIPAVTVVGDRLTWFVLNQQSAVLSDVVVRRALRAGLNRAGILQRTFLGGGVLSESLLPPFAPEYSRTLALEKFDLRGAAALLDAAGWKIGSDGVRVKNGRRLHIELVGGAGSGIVDQISSKRVPTGRRSGLR